METINAPVPQAHVGIAQVSRRRQELIKQAHQILQTALFTAWNEHGLMEALTGGKVEIVFVKVNGEVTRRIGTRNEQYIPADHLPRLSEPSLTAETLAFYSLTDNGWRSFRLENLVLFEKIVEQPATLSKTFWISEWNQESVLIIDRLGKFAPTWVPRSVISNMRLVEHSEFHKVYIYNVDVEKAWWEANVRTYEQPFATENGHRRGYRSDD